MSNYINLPCSEESKIINLPSVKEGVLLHTLLHESLKAYITYSQASVRPETDEMPIFDFATYHGNDVFTVYQQNSKYYAFIMLSDSYIHTNKEFSTYAEALNVVQRQFVADINHQLMTD